MTTPMTEPSKKIFLNIILLRISQLSTCTVAPCYNEPRYNEDPVITNNIWKPSRITVKYGETNPTVTNPAITNWLWQSQCTIYPTIRNISSCRSQSVKMTWWYKWLISQTQLLLVKIGKLWPLKVCFIKI